MRTKKISFTYVSLKNRYPDLSLPLLANLFIFPDLVANEKALKNSQSIAGNKDMTLYEVLELILSRSGSQGKQLPFK